MAHLQGLVWLDSLRDFEKDRVGFVPDTKAINVMLDAIADPQLSYRTVHIVGTNGKGTVASILTSILVGSGMHVGTYTSPDLGDLCERIEIDGVPVSPEALDDELVTLREIHTAFAMPELTRFEALTVAAFSLFAIEGVEIAVVEAGLGGEQDATNVLDSEVVIVPSISLDHEEQIGPTVVDIARVKAGVIHPTSKVILGAIDAQLRPIFESRATGGLQRFEAGIRLENESLGVGGWQFDLVTTHGRYRELFLHGHGRHQLTNAALAVAAAEEIGGKSVSEAVLRDAFTVGMPPGRIEVIAREPLVIVDVAHNAESAARLGETLREEFPQSEGWLVIVCLASGRDPSEFLRRLGPKSIDALVAVGSSHPHVDSVDVAHAASLLGIRSHIAEGLTDALFRFAPSDRLDQLVLVTGSHRIVGEARRNLSE